ncbi:hypothetical protein Q8A67_005286 [Cirrhinus molitorella]|uniref:Ig-like domain-containing protein n=1 Tax=Cirrhinus molitorella TaxID=172907 RepID=A0AA88Q3W5_9TELE|nr:hypothetical protein Q8A67_005286 [Cirrhinus molitorella]
MKIIWTFTLLMIPGVMSSISVTGYSGGGVIITCRYDKRYAANKKYFCRGEWSKCTDQVRTKDTNKWVNSGRFSLYDDTRAAVSTVTIRDLSKQDSGMYQCAVDITAKKDIYTEVKLHVLTADCCEKSISLSAAAGGSVNISCKYPQSHSADVKFVCRRSGSDLCAEETSVKESRRWSAEGQIQLYDDREQQLLTGTISHVTQQHSAEYWCGVQTDQGHKSFITRVRINVTDTSPLLPSSSPTASVWKTPTFNNTSGSPNTLKGSSLIISLVLVLLVLIIVCLLLLFLYKKHQSRGGESSSQVGAEKHEVVPNSGCDYEEIKDTHRQLPKNPSDSSNCIYTAVQKPTGDAQILFTSAEDLNYAVVNFQKKADCPDSLRLRNSQDYSEYAAVSHHTA